MQTSRTSITAESSHGTIEFTREGKVLGYHRHDESDPDSAFLSWITYVDTVELSRYLANLYATARLLGGAEVEPLCADPLDHLNGYADILDIGYLYRAPGELEEREEPCHAHRLITFEDRTPEEAGF